MRFVFSVSVKDVQLGNGGPPGGYAAETGWRAVTRVLRSSQAIGRAAVQGSLADVVNVLLPSDCRICGSPLVTLGRVRVCEACVDRLDGSDSANEDVLCTRCGDAMGMESARFAAAMGVGECTMCRLAPPEFTRAVAFANYDNEMREMLHLLKFAGMRSVAEHVLGERMAAAARRLRPDAAVNLVVIPVPLFASRARERGYNQARLLAEAMLRRLRSIEPAWKLALDLTTLSRIKDTRALYTLNPSQRRRSLQGAFRVQNATAIAGREVLLIDDIMTTGATARACARVLLRAGATRIWVVTAARAQPESVAARSAEASASSSGARWTMAAAPGRAIEPDVGRRKGFS